MATLRVTEIFLSLQGESRTVGVPTAFVRLTGCPLRCRWCDTEYAFHGGETLEAATVLERVLAYGVDHVTVTGGEPLAQRGCAGLLAALCDSGLQVSVETSGALDVCGLDPRVVRVMDLKGPSSGEQARNLYGNLDCLGERDQVKFVVADRADYVWARATLAEHAIASRCEVLVQPVHGAVAPADLAGWILEDRLPVRFQLQLHRLLWGGERGH